MAESAEIRYTTSIRLSFTRAAALLSRSKEYLMGIMLLFVLVALMVALALRSVKDQRVAVRVPIARSRRQMMRRR